MSMVLALAAAAASPVSYTVSVAAGTPPTVTIALAFSGDGDGISDVELPDRWAGSQELWRNLSAPVVDGGRLLPAVKPSLWRIAHRPNARITIRYTVTDPVAGVPGPDFEKAVPIVERDWIHMLGQGVFAVPAGREDAPARFGWGRLPRDWRVAADIEAPAEPLTVAGVAESVLIGGTALRIGERNVGTARLRVAVLGRWPYSDAALADALAALMPAENALLGARAVPYLVALMPLTGAERGAMSSGGTGRTAGFQLASTSNVPLAELTRTLAHEYGHRWFGRGFGGVADGAGPYWFTEGANDWFAGRAMVRAGLWTPRDWVAALNVVLMRYGSSTARGLTDAEVTAQFWTNPDAMQVQYDRGHLTLLLLDRQLAGWTLAILGSMAARPSAADQVARFSDAVDAIVPSALLATRQMVSQPLPPDAFAPCGTLTEVVQPRYDRGYDADAAGNVTRVRTESVRAAGIRAGMRAVRRLAFVPGDSAGLYTVRFADGAVERDVSWYPRGDATVRFQRLDGARADTAACRALVAGDAPTP